MACPRSARLIYCMWDNVVRPTTTGQARPRTHAAQKIDGQRDARTGTTHSNLDSVLWGGVCVAVRMLG